MEQKLYKTQMSLFSGVNVLYKHKCGLIVGFCILLRVYPLMLFLKTTARNNVFWLDFTVHSLLHVSALIGGRLMYILPEDGHRSGPKHVVSSAQ
jgi:hypothetical protein